MAFVSSIPIASNRHAVQSLSFKSPHRWHQPPRTSILNSAKPIDKRIINLAPTMLAELPPRQVLSPLPRVFVYDHCPFCVRIRHCLGLKNVKYELIWLMNDDVDTPTALVGKKIVPIFQPDGASGRSVFESMDIVNLVDSDARFGSPNLFRPASGRKDISSWMNELAEPTRRLTRIRFSRVTLPEFTFAEGREAFVRNHQLKSEPFSYEENFQKSAEYIAAIQPRLDELAAMIFSKEFCTEGGLSIDDIELFPKLRNLTIIKGLELPQRIREYLEFHAEQAEIPLYDNYAF